MDFTATVFDVELEVSFEISAYRPAKLYGPPEDCHPEEGGEIDLQSVMLDNNEVLPLLSHVVIAAIEEQAYAFAEQEADDEYDDDRDFFRDEERLAA